MKDLCVLEIRKGPRIQQDHTRLAESLLRLSTDPLTEPIEILRRMPIQAISPDLIALLDVLSTPILLFEEGLPGEQKEAQKSSLPKAA